MLPTNSSLLPRLKDLFTFRLHLRLKIDHQSGNGLGLRAMSIHKLDSVHTPATRHTASWFRDSQFEALSTQDPKITEPFGEAKLLSNPPGTYSRSSTLSNQATYSSSELSSSTTPPKATLFCGDPCNSSPTRFRPPPVAISVSAANSR